MPRASPHRVGVVVDQAGGQQWTIIVIRFGSRNLFIPLGKTVFVVFRVPSSVLCIFSMCKNFRA